jgi:hypothetical protein
VIYDNQVACGVDEQGDNDDPCTAVGGGNIKIHKTNGPAPAPLTRPGDINHDGVVDFNDFLIVANNFGHRGVTLDQGDIDGNGSVDFSDFLVVASQFQHLAVPPLSPVPEATVVDAVFGDDKIIEGWLQDEIEQLRFEEV